jgi:hypothetical protein
VEEEPRPGTVLISRDGPLNTICHSVLGHEDQPFRLAGEPQGLLRQFLAATGELLCALQQDACILASIGRWVHRSGVSKNRDASIRIPRGVAAPGIVAQLVRPFDRAKCMIKRIARVLHGLSSVIDEPRGCFDNRLPELAHARSLWYFGEHEHTPFAVYQTQSRLSCEKMM